ncbi:MAG: hypothetical protein HY876_07185 [Coriobacteriales bacterium]|nr:hypothetical protein [Coriobacteriales bacterium]
MVRGRPQLPAGHGEVLTRPDFGQWASIVEDNRRLAAQWDFTISGMAIGAFRSAARAQSLERAGRFSARLGVEVDPPGAEDAPIVSTGHQPDLYHTGVWVKDFLLDAIGRESAATAIDVVVDTDGFDSVQVASPCLIPGVQRCRQYLAIGSPGGCYAGTPVPSKSDIDDFCRAATGNLESLPAPAVRRHFDDFCIALRSAADDAENLAELMTFARRRYEAPAQTRYLELPVTELASSDAFNRFVAHVALDAPRFCSAYNTELAEYRLATNTRSSVQPFADLASEGDDLELPFWFVESGVRSPLWARAAGDLVELRAHGEVVGRLPRDWDGAAAAVAESAGLVAPKAVALTLFTRLFVSDLFIHGVGGARYDRVTDGVIRRYFGVEPPAFVVASMTMYLPLGAHIVTDDEVAEASERLNRFEHNPDQLLDQVEFESPEEQHRASELAAQKAALRRAISADGADKKTIGLRIREVNAELGEVLAPFGKELEAEHARLVEQREATEIFVDRTYPYAFWSPLEIADKVR